MMDALSSRSSHEDHERPIPPFIQSRRPRIKLFILLFLLSLVANIIHSVFWVSSSPEATDIDDNLVESPSSPDGTIERNTTHINTTKTSSQYEILRLNDKAVLPRTANRTVHITSQIGFNISNSTSELELQQTSLSDSNNNTQGEKSPLKFLWGIFTTAFNSSEEFERRQAIRKTYLDYYKTIPSKSNYNRICKLNDLLSGKLNQTECHIAYAFVVGANPNGTTELIQNISSLDDLIFASPPSIPDKEHNDFVYLNIRENMNEGKSPTWFRFATTLMDESSLSPQTPRLSFDYIAKMDTDLLMFPDRFTNWTEEQQLPSAPHNVHVYGGFPYSGKWCGGCNHLLVGPSFMGGEFYFMSPDLAAQAVSSPYVFNRTGVTVPGHEDISVGNWIHSYMATTLNSSTNLTLPVIGRPASHSVMSHPMKNPVVFQSNYLRRRGWT